MARHATYGAEPSYQPGHGETVAFFGADPSWTPRHEAASPYTCRRCGGKGLIFDATDPSAALPIPFRFDRDRHAIVTYESGDPVDRDGKPRFCAGCSRSGLDDMLARMLMKDSA